MDTWNCPKSLKMLSSRVVVTNFLKKTHFPEVGSPRDQVIRNFEYQFIPRFTQWWQHFPDFVKKLLQKSIVEVCDAHIANLSSRNFYKRIYLICFKLMTLDEVYYWGRESFATSRPFGFIFGDSSYSEPKSSSYDESDSESYMKPKFRVIFPKKIKIDFENVLFALIKVCGNFPMKKLGLHDQLSITVMEALLAKSPDLEVLLISQQNFKPDLIIIIFAKCSNLFELYLPYSLPCEIANGETDLFQDWPNLDRKMVTKLFACYFKKVFSPKVSIHGSLPRLRQLVCGTNPYGGCQISFLQLNDGCSTWFMHCNRSDYTTKMEKDLAKILTEERDLILNLSTVTLSFRFVVQLNRSQIAHFHKMFPKCENMTLSCDSSEYSNRDITLWKTNLSLLSNHGKPQCWSLFLVHETNLLTQTFLSSTLPIIGANINSLSFYFISHSSNFNSPGEANLLGSLQEIILNCPSLITLKLWFVSSFVFNFTPLSNENFEFATNKIRELWLRDSENSSIRFGLVRLLNLLQASSPELEFLSTTIHDIDSMATVMEGLSSNVSTLRLPRVGYVNSPIITFDQLKSVIDLFPKLKNLYLDGVTRQTFCKLKEHFSRTALAIFWVEINEMA